jgi:hypothetical protein
MRRAHHSGVGAPKVEGEAVLRLQTQRRGSLGQQAPGLCPAVSQVAAVHALPPHGGGAEATHLLEQGAPFQLVQATGNSLRSLWRQGHLPLVKGRLVLLLRPGNLTRSATCMATPSASRA